MAAADWWDALRQRFPHECIHYAPVNFDVDARLPSALFDSVADNLLHNAMIKQQSEHTLCIEVSLSADASILRVSDDGSALSEVVAVRLFRQPIASESGFGIGLLNAASQAAAQGFDLVLCGQTKLFDQLLAVSRRTSISKVLKDQFAARNRVFIFFRFTSGLGIEGLPIGH